MSAHDTSAHRAMEEAAARVIHEQRELLRTFGREPIKPIREEPRLSDFVIAILLVAVMAAVIFGVI